MPRYPTRGIKQAVPSLFEFEGPAFLFHMTGNFKSWAETLWETGSVEHTTRRTKLITGTTSGARAAITTSDIQRWTFAKNSRVQFVAKFTATTNQLGYVFVGSSDEEGYGFKIDDNTIFAQCAKSGEIDTVNLGQIIADTTYVFTAIFTAGVKCDFYIDGVHKTTMSNLTYIPTRDFVAMDGELFFFIRTTAAENKELWASEARFYQEP